MGTNSSVIMVPTSKPLIMATAMLAYIGSLSNGSIPRMVVKDASNTGLAREIVAFMRAACFAAPLAIRFSASFKSTIAFFTIIPISPNEPMIAIKVNG